MSQHSSSVGAKQVANKNNNNKDSIVKKIEEKKEKILQKFQPLLSKDHQNRKKPLK